MPRLSTFHPLRRRIIQWPYCPSGSSESVGGDSSGDEKKGVPAVVESPIAAIVTGRTANSGAESKTVNPRVQTARFTQAIISERAVYNRVHSNAHYRRFHQAARHQS